MFPVAGETWLEWVKSLLPSGVVLTVGTFGLSKLIPKVWQWLQDNVLNNIGQKTALEQAGIGGVKDVVDILRDQIKAMADQLAELKSQLETMAQTLETTIQARTVAEARAAAAQAEAAAAQADASAKAGRIERLCAQIGDLGGVPVP